MFFTLDLLQLIVVNLEDHFRHRHFQVGAKTFLFLFMVTFCSFMDIFWVFGGPRTQILCPWFNAPPEDQKVC